VAASSVLTPLTGTMALSVLAWVSLVDATGSGAQPAAPGVVSAHSGSRTSRSREPKSPPKAFSKPV
jgi:hypothetical protein